MRKWLILLFSIVLILPVSSALAEAPNANDTKLFTQSLEKSLVKGNFYYDENSIEIMDSIQLDGNVTKVIKQDDPATEEDETNIETYKSNLIVALVQIKEKRDSVFYFNKKELYYYDVKNNEFLVYSTVHDNPEIEKFLHKYTSDLGKHLSIGSLLLLLIILSTPFILAYFIYVFHNEKKTNQKIYFFDKYSSGHFG